MIVLQPAMIWGLGVAALPILIHLLNRLRYRTVRWGAMQFLRRVARSASRRSRWRHWLVLACRTLALAALALAMVRPLVGGRLGRLGRGGAPDAVIVLLDRSASMERIDGRSGQSLREQALAELAAVPSERVRGSRIVLIESVFRTPREVAALSALRHLVWTEQTDTAADWPALFDAALDWIERHRPGRTEIWAVSDAQTSNWRPASLAWGDLGARLADMAPAPRIRALLADSASPAANRSIRADGVRRLDDGVALGYTLEAPEPRSETVQAALLTPSGRVLHPLPTDTRRGAVVLPGGDRAGWAGLQLPADGYVGDNAAWYVFGPAPEGDVWVATENETLRRRIRHSFLPARAADRHPVRLWPLDAEPPVLDGAALVVWQGAPPRGAQARALDTFIRDGGVTLALPPAEQAVLPDTADAADDPALWAWAAMERAPAGRAWRVARWERYAGPFARTRDGDDVPVGEAAVRARSLFAGRRAEAAYAMAHFDDGAVAVTRENRGNGRLYALAALPSPEWSDLGDGRLWVPILWRLREEGGRRLGEARMGVCGDWQPGSPEALWEAAHTDERLDPRIRAGVYRLGARWMALNRPEEEDDDSALDAAALRALLPGVRLDVVAPVAGRLAGPTEMSGVLFLMAGLFLLAEAALALERAS